MPLLVLLFVVVPLAELYVIIEVGSAIGIVPTIAILFADSVIGAMLLRSQGRSAWIRFNRALGQGRMPGREVFDGVVIIFGGALLLTPGFITDVVGLLFLLPFTRAAIRRAATRSVKRRMEAGQVRVFGAGPAFGGWWRGSGRGPGPGTPGGGYAGGAGRGPGSGPGHPGGPPRSGRAASRPGDIEGTATEIPDDEHRLGEGGGAGSEGDVPPEEDR